MTTPPPYTRYDRAALAIGLGLVLVGVVVMGFFETVLGSLHFTQRVGAEGVIVVHTSFTPDGRAYTIATGFAVLFGWTCSRVLRAIRA